MKSKHVEQFAQDAIVPDLHYYYYIMNEAVKITKIKRRKKKVAEKRVTHTHRVKETSKHFEVHSNDHTIAQSHNQMKQFTYENACPLRLKRKPNFTCK